MGMNDIAIGNLVVSRVVEDVRALFDTARFFPHLTEAAIADARGWMDERFFDAQSGCFVLAVQSYVVRRRAHDPDRCLRRQPQTGAPVRKPERRQPGRYRSPRSNHPAGVNNSG